MHRRAAVAVAAASLGLAAAALGAGCLLSIDESLLASDASPGVDAISEDAADAGATVDGFSEGSVDGPPVESGSQGEAGGAPDGHGDVGAGDGPVVDTGPPTCPTGMIEVPAAGGGASYCVDATEVTSKAYSAFVAAADPPAAGSQIAACSWNTSYHADALGADDVPVGGIDWCDAYAYCKWAGKRLCGAVGGGAFPFASWGPAATSSQWQGACTRAATRAFPYGGTYQPTACNGAPRGASAAVAVGSLGTCEGGYTGLFDMSGNVAEFLDACDTTPESACGSSGPECDLCLLVGGSFLDGADSGTDMACAYGNEVYRNARYVDDGLRCCADL
jgi:sulfatase modifying factor 1